MTDDTQKITDLLQNYETFCNAGEYSKVGALYDTDAILLPDRFDVFEGVESITGFYQFAFSMLELDITFTIDAKNILVAGDFAYATTHSAGTRYLKESKETVPEINRELWIFRRVDADWKIARYCFNKSS